LPGKRWNNYPQISENPEQTKCPAFPGSILEMNRWQHILLLIMGLVAGSATGQQPASGVRPPSGKGVQIGTASFYADKFEGRSMANGETFRQRKLTAACNTLRLNVWVKVTNLRNHRSVIVRITDRMHRRNKRLIDLSRAAASILGYTASGLARVKVELLPSGRRTGQ
jgi:rare lipoprotein A